MREIIDLDGIWRFVPDLDPEYHRSAEQAQPGWDRRHWALVPVPACWNLYGERYALYEGVAWYARTFTLADWPQDALGILRFGAVNYEAQVFVNGEKAGEHVGGYTEFTLDVTRLLRAGENLLVVRVDDRRNRILLPACMGWFNYGGIHRSVTLEVTHGARLEWVGVDAAPAGEGAEGRVRIEWRSLGEEPLVCRMTVRDVGGAGDVIWQQEAALGAEAAGQLTLPFRLAQVQPWSPASPTLYEFEAVLCTAAGEALDRVSTSFGVRRLQVQGTQILLNDQPIWLKGICYLEDHPAIGIAYNEEIARRDLDDMQALGINALRCHVPLHERMLQECDRRGLLVWSEVPVYCLDPAEPAGSAFSDPRYLALATGMLREEVRAAYNHPSIALWSIGNECKVAHPEAPAFFAELARTVRALDDTRLLTYASLYGEVGPVADLIDVIGVNEYWGWYDRLGATPDRDRPLPARLTANPDGSRTVEVDALDLSRLQQEVAEKGGRYNKPLLFSEFGADAVPGYRAADLPLWSEDYQAHVLEHSFRVLMAAGNVCGAFPFLYQDYPDPSKPTNGYWHGLNLKGIVTYDRVHKAAYDTLRDIYWRGQSSSS